MRVNCPLVSAFFRQAEERNDSLALIEPHRETSYAELRTEVETLAARLPDRSDDIANVAIVVDSPRNALIAIWAVLTSGGAYVPLSTADSAAFNADIVRTTEARAIICDRRDFRTVLGTTDSKLLVAMDGNGAAGKPRFASAKEGDRAYILSTSGTTGRPKAVMQNRANVALHAERYAATVKLGQGIFHTWLPHYGFDAACMDIFGAVLHGATLVCPGFGVAGLNRAAELFTRHPPNVFHSTPTVYRALARQPGARSLFRKAEFVVLGGEPAFAGDLSTFLSTCPDTATLINGLGPSECSIALQCRFTRDAARTFQRETDSAAAALPVGWPVDGIHARAEPADEAVGELQLSGDGVFEGYWADHETTEAATVTEVQRRWYKTGDMVARHPRWGFVFRGRRDHKIKIRGQWVDLAACAAVLRNDPLVVDAWVAPDVDATGDIRSLTAFVQFANGNALSAETLAKLPEVTRPLKVRPVSNVPIASNGKRSVSGPEPLSLSEVTVAAVLGLLAEADLEIDPDEDIFDAGLDSLTFTELAVQAQHLSGRILDFDEFLAEPTVRHFVQLLGNDRR